MNIKTRAIFSSLIINLFLYPIHVCYSNEWATFNTENTGLPSNNILCITIDNWGTKWFGTDQGLVQFNGEKWKIYASDSNRNFADNYVNDVIFESFDNQSLIWGATENGISLLDITHPEAPIIGAPYRVDNSGLIDNVVKTLTVDPGHVRWFGTFSGVSNLQNDIWGTYSTQNYWIEHNKVVSLASGPDSMIYIGTEGGGVSRLKMEPVDGVTSASPLTTTWTGFYEPDSGKLTSNNIYSILIEQNGHQWFGTDSGVALHKSYNTLRDWKNYTSSDGLVDNIVQAICKENENIIWFGTPDGVSRFDGLSWTSYTSEDGLVHNNVRDIAIDPDGTLWFATEAGISSLKNTTAVEWGNSISRTESLTIHNYPNPFNSYTIIEFTVSTKSFVQIEIYNIKGQQIVPLLSEIREAGQHSMKWNGIDATGKVVPTGIYFVKLSTGKHAKTHKVLVTK